MSDTIAVPATVLADANPGDIGGGQPLCPSCNGGHLHPYRVEIAISHMPGGWNGANYLTGWVAVCVGNAAQNRRTADLYRATGQEPGELPELEPCGFSMPMTPHRYGEAAR